MYATPRKSFYMLVERRPELMQVKVHEPFVEAETDLEAHREAKKYIETSHNKNLQLLKCQMIGDYAYKSVFFPENWSEMKELENPDPQ